MGGGGGNGKDSGKTASSAELALLPSGSGGGGGGGGTVNTSSSNSVPEDDAPALDEAPDKGILGPIDDLNIGGFPGGGAPVGFNVGW